MVELHTTKGGVYRNKVQQACLRLQQGDEETYLAAERGETFTGKKHLGGERFARSNRVTWKMIADSNIDRHMHGTGHCHRRHHTNQSINQSNVCHALSNPSELRF